MFFQFCAVKPICSFIASCNIQWRLDWNKNTKKRLPPQQRLFRSNHMRATKNTKL